MWNRVFVAALASLFLALPARATSVVPLYLDEIVDGAATAFQGICIENRPGRDSQTGLAVTFTTFQVQDTLRGSVGPTYTIKQIGGKAAAGAPQYKVQGIPEFTVGESYVVFLYGVSAAGFSSPVGLEQGKFTVSSDGVQAQVSNGRDFKEMTARLPEQALSKAVRSKMAEAGPVQQMALDDFKQLVRQRDGMVR